MTWTDRPLRTAPLVFFDLETTALRPDRGGRICEMAVVDQNGIRFDWCSDAASPRDDAVSRQLPTLVGHLESGIVVGHNLQFDFRFLTYEAERLALNGLDLRFVDTLGLARFLLAVPDTNQIEALLRHFAAVPRKTLHSAAGDALANRPLFWHSGRHDNLDTLPATNSHTLQCAM